MDLLFLRISILQQENKPMRTLKFSSKSSRLLLVIPFSVSLSTSGCAMLPLAAAGTGATGAGLQALGSAAGAAGIQALGEKVGDAIDYMRGGEQMVDVTYWTRPAPLKDIVAQTLRDTVSSAHVVFEYSRSVQGEEDWFVLSASTGSELRILVKEDSSFQDLHATQMVVEMETAEAAHLATDTLEFVDAVQEIDSKTERRGIEKIRGDFNYAEGIGA
jgi:hypothetical protein